MYVHRVMYKKYTTPCPHMGCGVVERHLEMAQPTKKDFANSQMLQIWAQQFATIQLSFN